MKNIIAGSIFSLLLLSSCLGHIPKGKEKKDLYGKWDENTYTNAYFDFGITLNEHWKIEKSKLLTVLAAEFATADYYEQGDTLNSLVRLVLGCEKMNPFDNKANVEEELQMSVDAFKSVYDESEFICDPFKKIQLGKRQYLCSHLILLDEGDSTFVDEYVSHEKDYYLSFSLSYSSKLDEPILQEVLKQIK